jgi:hypothetical protein
MPNHWLLGNAIGVWVDSTDTVWIVHRGSATLANNEKALELKQGDCCAGAPPILAFDKQGNLVRHWGGPGAGYDWPSSNHGIFIDHTGMVWIGGNGPGDSQIMKFTKDGKFVAQYGKPNARVSARTTKARTPTSRGSSDPSNFGRVAKIFVDPKANEAYIADGYFNRRVAVLDAATGSMKRFLGRLRQEAGRRDPARRLRSGGAAAAALPQSRCTAQISPTTASSTSATASTIASRCSSRTAPSSRKRSWPRTRASRVRCGTSLSPGIRSSVFSTSPTA